MIEKIKKHILELCGNQDWEWDKHTKLVVKFSKQLATELNADEEICKIAAWLHDIKKIQKENKKHHVHGAEEAGEILRKLGYPKEKIKQVQHCILTHSSDQKYIPKSKEAKIVACADSLAQFADFSAMAYYAYTIKELSIQDGQDWLLRKYEINWNKLDLITETKKMARSQYDAIQLLLKIK